MAGQMNRNRKLGVRLNMPMAGPPTSSLPKTFWVIAASLTASTKKKKNPKPIPARTNRRSACRSCSTNRGVRRSAVVAKTARAAIEAHFKSASDRLIVQNRVSADHKTMIEIIVTRCRSKRIPLSRWRPRRISRPVNESNATGVIMLGAKTPRVGAKNAAMPRTCPE